VILGRFRLTARRRQCLLALRDAVAAGGGAAHYSAVAEPLGISSWTAYDLLRELERDGLAAAVYSHRPGVAVGRAQVGFLPTEAGRRVLGETVAGAEDRALQRARAGFARLGPVAAARAVLEWRPRGLDLAGHLGFWLHQADGLSGRTRERLQQLLRNAPEAATALSMFVATVYGAVGAGRDGELAEALTAEVSAFQARLARTTAARRERLLRSLTGALESLSPVPDAPVSDRA